MVVNRAPRIPSASAAWITPVVSLMIFTWPRAPALMSWKSSAWPLPEPTVLIVPALSTVTTPVNAVFRAVLAPAPPVVSRRPSSVD